MGRSTDDPQQTARARDARLVDLRATNDLVVARTRARVVESARLMDSLDRRLRRSLPPVAAATPERGDWAAADPVGPKHEAEAEAV